MQKKGTIHCAPTKYKNIIVNKRKDAIRWVRDVLRQQKTIK